MDAATDLACRIATGAGAREQARCVAAHAHAARHASATAQAHRSRALALDRQADRATELMFGQAAETFRAAAAENRFMTDRFEAIENRKNV